MRKATSANFALIGPKRPSARCATRLFPARVARFSFDGYLGAAAAPDCVVLCPGGSDTDADIGFLLRAKTRLLWPPPPRDIADAIAGLVTSAPPGRGRPAARRRGRLSPALLLEGSVTRARARAALSSPVRLWVVESPRQVRLSEAQLKELARAGVRWAALFPLELAGIVASPALRAARRRWRHLLPARAEVWTRPSSAGPPRKPSRR